MQNSYNITDSMVCARKLKSFSCDSILYRIAPDGNGTLVVYCAKCGGTKSIRKLNVLNKK